MTTDPGREPSQVLVLQPDQQCGPARFAAWAEESDIDFDVRAIVDAADVPPSLDGFAGLIVLGGDMGDGDTAQYPWLEDIRERLREAHDRELPTLGICLGAQLLASALGGEVRPGAAGLETGVVEVHRVEAARDDRLLQGVSESFLSGAMHSDAIVTLPPEAELLATGEQYPHQAFRVGSAWGVQFHPEIGSAEYAAWGPTVCAAIPGLQPAFDASALEFERLDQAVERDCSLLAKNFFSIVRTAPEANGLEG